MKRNVWMATAFMCAASAVAAAQSGASATSSSMADKTITVTGCVQNISSSATTGTTEKGFLLANAMMSPSTSTASTTPGSTEGATRPSPTPTQAGTASGTPTGTAGTSTMPSSTSAGTSYVLSGRDSELKNHVGHKVEVTGTIDAKSDTKTPTTSAPPTMTASTKLNVTSVKMISSDCSAK
jgi:hypothetical protein